MAGKVTTHRFASGAYVVTDGVNVVDIDCFGSLPASAGQWVAAARWNRDLVTDPVMTKREAVVEAVAMLVEQGGTRAGYLA